MAPHWIFWKRKRKRWCRRFSRCRRFVLCNRHSWEKLTSSKCVNLLYAWKVWKGLKDKARLISRNYYNVPSREFSDAPTFFLQREGKVDSHESMSDDDEMGADIEESQETESLEEYSTVRSSIPRQQRILYFHLERRSHSRLIVRLPDNLIFWIW